MKVTQLPTDVFTLIVTYLSPNDLILCRCVTKDFFAALTDPNLCRHVLLQHFPRARESRILNGESGQRSKGTNWADAFHKVAARYHYLRTGAPSRINRFPLGRSFVAPKWSRQYPVAPWRRHLQFEEKMASFHYPDTLWTYDQGVLIFPSSEAHNYVLFDLEVGTTVNVNIESEKRIVRRIRLQEKVLVVEWCEEEAYHQLNESETAYRHFASAYDVVQDASSMEWKVILRIGSLLCIHRNITLFTSGHLIDLLGAKMIPLRHWWSGTPQHQASSYLPSLDPSGVSKPPDMDGPRVILRLSFTDLDFYQVRQGSTPTLQRLELDQSHVYIVQENHRWLVGQQATFVLPRLHEVKTVGIPFNVGPCWEDSCDVDGDVNTSFCERGLGARGPNIPPCWRHEEFPDLTVAEVVDLEARVSFSARHCFMLETISLQTQPGVDGAGTDNEVSLNDKFWKQLLAKGKICGDERWLIGENADQDVVILYFG